MIKQPKVQSAVIGLLAALCLVGIGVEAAGAGKAPTATARSAVKLTGASLVSYTNCPQMLEQVKAQALKEVAVRASCDHGGCLMARSSTAGSAASISGPGPWSLKRRSP